MTDDAAPPTLLQRDHVTRVTSREGRERFAPGSMVAGRYRIVALLGRGGMGEVYRADDIRLDQPVALKFLPLRLESNAEALELFLAEIRLGRQVSHPNVCRLYDLGEHEGHHFITMEYVDGENLASLLQRIGRLPSDKAVEFARDITAGLAAAHALGIVHRDLKPSNVMIDGKGRARVTDFGLAAVGAEIESDGRILGTPAYMAPEQRSGGTATTRSDVYSLGLVIYECLTGRKYHDSASSDVPEIDAAIHRVVRRCLDPDPQRRPESARDVLAALPGGDPLAAALAAGHTPSPELVAAATTHSELSVRAAWMLLASMVVIASVISLLTGKVQMHHRIGEIRSPEAQAERAAEIATSLGAVVRDRSSMYMWERPQLRWLAQNGGPKPDWTALLNTPPSPLHFMWRSSPQPMFAYRVENYIGRDDPALDVPGMSKVILDSRGRLLEFARVPPALPPNRPSQPAAWTKLFELAGLPLARFTSTAPQWSAPVASDERFAWTGTAPNSTREIRIEAASRAGQPVWFAAIHPWRTTPGTASGLDAVGEALMVLVEIAIPLITVFLAFLNLRRGRGDRRGALRIALVVLVTLVTARFVRAHHAADAFEETQILKDILGDSLVAAVIAAFAYLGLEPYVRRYKPEALISWVRLLNGRLRDPLVGRDVLIGLAGGMLAVLLWMATLASQPLFGWREAMPSIIRSSTLSGLNHVVHYLLFSIQFSVMDGITFATLLVLFIALVKNRRIAVVLLFLAVTALLFRVPGDLPQTQIAYAAGASLMALLVFRYGGVLGITAMSFVAGLYTVLPLTLDPNAFYFGRSMIILLLPVALAVLAFRNALAGKPAFGD